MLVMVCPDSRRQAYSSGSEDEDEDEFDYMGIDHGTEPWLFL